MTHPLLGRQPLPNRPDATIGEVREVEGGVLLTVRWESVPFVRDGRVLGMTPVATTWLRCTEQEPDLVFELIREWIERYHEHDDPRISDVEPPPDVPCGGWLAPDGKHWRGSEGTHPLVAKRAAKQLGLSLGPHDAASWLETHGWIHILDDGTNNTTDSLTQAQRDTLFDLARQFSSMRGAIVRALRREE
jgi:hypothetical protein